MDAKQCPTCNEWRLKDSACNYVTCNNNYSSIKIDCNIPWCWECSRVKGTKSDQCNDKTHNSH